MDSIRQEAVEELDQEEDRLSQLPDDVLMYILDKLVLLRDAVKTSILSRRWRHLSGLHSEIVLDVMDFEPEDDGSKYTLDELARSNLSVVQATKSILAHKSQRAIRYLSITFYLRDESIDIVRSVDNAMGNRDVVNAAFMIIPEITDKYCTVDDMLTYGRRFMTFIGAYPRAFAGLADLCIYSLRLNQSDFTNVLNTCKKLKYLRLQNCDAGFQSVLQIDHPELVEMNIFSCALEKIKFNCLPRLSHLSFSTWLPSNQYPLSFGYVPQLWKLYISNPGTTFHKTLKLSELLSNSTIRELELNFQSNKIWIHPEGPKLLAPLLQNLQVVHLYYVREECNIIWTMFFLEAAPRLRDIYIQVWGHKCYEEDEYNEDEIFQNLTDDHLTLGVHDHFRHYNLSRLTIEGFQVEEMFTRFIKHVMATAPNLELISLLECRPCPRCQFLPSTAYPRTKEQRNPIEKLIKDWRESPIKIEFGMVEE